MKKWFMLWIIVAAVMYEVYSYTIDVAEQFSTNVGTVIETVAGRR